MPKPRFKFFIFPFPDLILVVPLKHFISMNLFKLSWSYLKRQKLTAVLNTLLLGLGIATIVLLLLFSRQFSEKLERDAQGVDMVVGAKGSPLQLILSGVYQMDVPTGNIPLSEVNKLKSNRLVKEVIPISMGDSYGNFRIVGTTEAYPNHYGASVAQGRMFQEGEETVIGAQVAEKTGLKVGDSFVSSHGLVQGGDGHDKHPYKVVGIFASTNTVLDRVIVTSLEAVWDVHGIQHQTEAAPQDGHDDEHAEHRVAPTLPPANADPNHIQPLPVQPLPPPASVAALDPNAGASPELEVTVALVKFASPLAAVMLPRAVNSQTKLQAARPAEQMANLLQLVGIGLGTIRAFGYILMLSALLGVFVALYNAMQERRYDLAMMRAMGASREKLLLHVLLEGLVYATLGILFGLVLGHGVTEILGRVMAASNQVAVTGFMFAPDELGVILMALAVGLIAALIPAFQAYRTDIAKTLAE